MDFQGCLRTQQLKNFKYIFILFRYFYIKPENIEQITESLKDAEKNLQDQLRQMCDSNGRETNPQASAAIFDKLGLLYRQKSPDKISLIQSAALFSAAIVRQPSNQKFRDHLQELCSHILICANAEQKKANLI